MKRNPLLHEPCVALSESRLLEPGPNPPITDTRGDNQSDQPQCRDLTSMNSVRCVHVRLNVYSTCGSIGNRTELHTDFIPLLYSVYGTLTYMHWQIYQICTGILHNCIYEGNAEEEVNGYVVFKLNIHGSAGFCSTYLKTTWRFFLHLGYLLRDGNPD